MSHYNDSPESLRLPEIVLSRIHIVSAGRAAVEQVAEFRGLVTAEVHDLTRYMQPTEQIAPVIDINTRPPVEGPVDTQTARQSLDEIYGKAA